MENGGNSKVNAIFEARLPNASIKPTNHADGPTRERYIRDKYERRKYFDPSGFADYEAAASSSSSMAQPPPSEADPRSASVGPPSDAAKQRLEHRRARINKASSAVGQGPEGAPRRRIVAKAPASAPPPTSVDLLDLMGGFDEPAAAPSPGKSTPQPPGGEPGLDLFDFVTAEKQWDNPQQQPQQAESAPAPPPQQLKKPALDLMSLYNGVQQQQQPGFGNFGGVPQQQQQQQFMVGGMQRMNGGGGMPNNGMMMNHHGMMNGGGVHNNMQQMTNSMQHLNFQQQQQQPQQMSQQQQQQQLYQQQMMMMQQQQQQQQMMMMNGGNVHGGGGSNNNNMRHGGMTQQQPPNHGFGAAKPAAAAVPEKDDPFAQFGSNVFRS